MKNEKYTKILQGILTKKCNVKLFIEGQDFGIFKYNDENEIYQGEFGYITLDKLIKCLSGDKAFDFVKVEYADEMEL